MQLRKVKINETDTVFILCQRCYQTFLEGLRLRFDCWELFHPVNPASGILHILEYWDTDWKPWESVKNKNYDLWECKNGCRDLNKIKTKQLKLF